MIPRMRGPGGVHGAAAIAILSASALAGGCALTQSLMAPRVGECRGFDVPLSTLAVSSRKELHVQVFAQRVENNFPFVVESSADRFVLVGFTPLGTKAFTLERQGEDVKVDNLIGPAQLVPPRNIMADVLAMSVPSTCSATPEGVAVSPAGDWQINDTCKAGRPVLRHIRKPDAKAEDQPEVEVEYGGDMIVVRQKHCRYAARYMLQGAPLPATQSLVGAAPQGGAPATPVSSAAPQGVAPATPVTGAGAGSVPPR